MKETLSYLSLPSVSFWASLFEENWQDSTRKGETKMMFEKYPTSLKLAALTLGILNFSIMFSPIELNQKLLLLTFNFVLFLVFSVCILELIGEEKHE